MDNNRGRPNRGNQKGWHQNQPQRFPPPQQYNRFPGPQPGYENQQGYHQRPQQQHFGPWLQQDLWGLQPVPQHNPNPQLPEAPQPSAPLQFNVPPYQAPRPNLNLIPPLMMIPPPAYIRTQPRRHQQDRQHHEPPQNRRQFVAENASEYLDKIPSPEWGTVTDQRFARMNFDRWRLRNSGCEEWFERNILMMDKGSFKRSSNQRLMMGIYKFSAYVRMYNWMSLNDNQRNRCIMLGNVNLPVISQEEALLDWFLSPRGEHQHYEITEDMARRFLDQDILDQDKDPDVYEKFMENIIGCSENRKHWVGANIFCMSTDNNWDQVHTLKHKIRMLNWDRLHPSWFADFHGFAIIPFTRNAPEGVDVRPTDIECLLDDPSSHGDLVLSSELAHAFLDRQSYSSFTESQTKYLIGLWLKKNEAHNDWLIRYVPSGNTRRLAPRLRGAPTSWPSFRSRKI